MQMVIGGNVRYIFSSLLAELWYSIMGIAIYQKNKDMTPKELYDWAVENGAEEYDIRIEWMNEYGFGFDLPEENQISINNTSEQITIDI